MQAFSSMRPIDQLTNVAITDLNVGDVRFRRTLINSGFTSLPTVFDAPDDVLLRTLDDRSIFILDSLKKQYEKNPILFVEDALAKKNVNGEDAKKSGNQKPSTIIHTPRPPAFISHGLSSDTQQAVKKLTNLEPRIHDTFNILGNINTTFLAYEAFDDFVFELDELESSFNLFIRGLWDAPTAARLIKSFFPCSFILFAAHRVYVTYDGNNLWGNFFAGLPISTQADQSEYKRLLIACLESQGMPTFGQEEKDFYYFYTALLHAGLTVDAWRSLWDRTLIPMIRDNRDNNEIPGVLVGTTMLTGHVVFQKMKLENKYTPKETVAAILNKAPERVSAAILDAALDVARQLNLDSPAQISTGILAKNGLPPAALDALEQIQNKSAKSPSVSPRNRHFTSSKAKLVIIQEGSLFLDLDEGHLLLTWRKQKLPEDFAGCRLHLVLNGEELLQKEVLQGIGVAVLEDISIEVPPNIDLSVCIKLMKHIGKDEWIEVVSIEQTFPRTQPGCLEFLRMPSGIFQHKSKKNRITREYDIAYVLSNERSVRPIAGMTPLGHYDGKEWGKWHAQVFHVKPGSSGAIVDIRTNEEIIVWQEDIIVTIDRDGAIGRNEQGFDLFGVSKDGPNNLQLPTISLETPDVASFRGNLRVECVFDGWSVLPQQRIDWSDEESLAGSISFLLSQTPNTPFFAQHCEIKAWLASTNAQLFKYRFSIVPIESFALKSVSLQNRIASWQITVAQSLEIYGEEESLEINPDEEDYFVHIPLSEQTAVFSIRDPYSNLQLHTRIALAGLAFHINEKAQQISEEHPLTFTDLHEHDPSLGIIKVESFGTRAGRRMLLMLGEQPLAFRNLELPGTHQFSSFSDKECLLPNSGEEPSDRPLTLTLWSGPSYADITLLKCKTGLGFNRPKIIFYAMDNVHALCLDAPAPSDIYVEIFRSLSLKQNVVFWNYIKKGEERIILPVNVVRMLNTHRKLSVRFCLLSMFGTPEREYFVTFPLERISRETT